MYRVIAQLTEPATALVILLGLLLLLAATYAPWKKGKRIAIAACYFLLWFSLTPLCAYLAVGSLEWHYPPVSTVQQEADAIVVLGAYVRPAESGLPVELGSNSVQRCSRAAELYHQHQLPIVVSGGTLDESPTAISVAEAMADYLIRLGVREEDLIVEAKSKSTYENAVLTAEILHRRSFTRILLVTDAMHLSRAECCFTAQGLTVAPVGCNYRARRLKGSVLELLPMANAGARTESAVHEWVGFVWYYLSGKF